MRILKTLLLLPLKLLALPVLFLLKVIYVLAGLVTAVGSYILSPLVLFILVFAIWSATQREWTDVVLLGSLEVLIIAAAFVIAHRRKSWYNTANRKTEITAEEDE